MLSFTLIIALLLGGAGALPGGSTSETPENTPPASQTPPPADNDARAHIIDIG